MNYSHYTLLCFGFEASAGHRATPYQVLLAEREPERLNALLQKKKKKNQKRNLPNILYRMLAYCIESYRTYCIEVHLKFFRKANANRKKYK